MGDFAMYRATSKTRERRLFSVQVCVLFLSSLIFAAPPVVLPRLPAAETLDTEVTTNLPLRIAGNRLALALKIAASASNNLEVAFGEDVDADGTLDAEEESCVLGWDSGAWFVRDCATGGESRAERDAGWHRLQALFDFATDGSLRTLQTAEGSTAECVWRHSPRLLLAKQANLMRMTARGTGLESAQITIAPRKIGLSMHVR